MSVSLINGHIDRGSMTPQEALAWVEDYEKAIKEEQAIVNNGDEFHVEALKVCEVVKQALEKQIPKKPVENKCKGVQADYVLFACPNCKQEFQFLKDITGICGGRRMTDKEIIKALECCIEWETPEDCGKCPYKYTKGCVTEQRKNALDLINRQQAKIEKLNQILEDDREIINEKCDELQNVKKELEHLPTLIAEAIKEFAERLKLKVDIDLCEAIECSDYLYNLPKLIDNLIKEMVGEDK